MVRIFNDNTHVFQRHYGFPSQVMSRIKRQIIKIAALIRYFRFPVVFKIKILKFRAHIKQIVTHSGHLFKIPFQYETRVSIIRFVVGRVQIAEHAGNGILLRPPWQYLKS